MTQSKEDIRQAITSKGVSVPTAAKLSSFPSYISEISGQSVPSEALEFPLVWEELNLDITTLAAYLPITPEELSGGYAAFAKTPNNDYCPVPGTLFYDNMSPVSLQLAVYGNEVYLYSDANKWNPDMDAALMETLVPSLTIKLFNS